VNKWLFLAFLALYLLTASGRIDSGDGHVMFQVTDSIMRGEGFAISPALPEQDLLGPHGERIPHETIYGSGAGAFGVDGRYYAQYGPGQSFAAIPFYLLGRVMHVILPVWSEEFWTRTSVTLLNVIVTALTVVLMAEMARLFFDAKTALTLAVIFGLATPAWPYSRSFFNEPLAGGLMLLGGYAAMCARRDARLMWYVLSGAAFGAAAFVRPTALLVVPPAMVYLFLACRPNKWKWCVWGGTLAIPLVFLLVYNWVRFGNPLTTGYGPGVRWDLPPWIGAYGLLFGPGKGLVWFAPVIVLGVVALPAFIRRSAAEGWFIVGVAGLFLAGHSAYNFWHGGGGWGPRLILPVVAWLILPMGVILQRKRHSAWQDLALAVVLAASVVVQVLGTSVNYARHLQVVYNASRSSEEYFQRVQFHWADSPIVGQVRELQAVTSNVRRAETLAELRDMVARTVTAPISEDRFYDAQAEAVGLLSFNVPDYWFVYGWFLGVPIWVMAVIMAALVCMIVISTGRLRTVPDPV